MPVIESVLQELRLANLVSLQLWEVKTLAKERWRGLFGQAARLSRIKSDRAYADGLLQAMEPRERSGLSFPVLTTLTLERLRIEPVSLKQVLQERAKKGAKVDELNLRSVDGLGEEDLESLRAVVGSAYWDGKRLTSRQIARKYST